MRLHLLFFGAADLFLQSGVILVSIYTKYDGHQKPSPEEKSLAAQ